MPDIWDEIAEDVGARSDNVAVNSLIAQKRNPALVARATKLADKYGVASALVEAQPEVYETRDRKDKADRLTADNPWVTPHLIENPDTAAMMQEQDFPAIDAVSRMLGVKQDGSKTTFKDLMVGTAGTLLKYATGIINPSLLGQQLGQRKGATFAKEGVADYRQSGESGSKYLSRYVRAMPSQAGLGLLNTARGGMGLVEMATSISTALVGAEDPLFKHYREQEEIYKATVKLYTPEWAKTDFQKGVLSGMQSITQMGLTAPLGAGRMLYALSAVSAGSAEAEFRSRGAGVFESAVGAIATGVIEGVTERMFGGMGRGGFLDVGKYTTSGFAKYLVRDVGGEQFATGGGNIVDTLVTGSQYETWGDFVKDAPSQAMQTLWATLTMGGAVGAFGASRNQFRKLQGTHEAAVEGLFGHHIISGLMEQAAKTPLREGSPSAFAKLIKDAVKQSPIKRVIIPIEAIDRVLQDDTFTEEEKAALTVYQNEIDDNRGSTNEIEVPIGEAMAKLAGTKVWAAIEDDIKVMSLTSTAPQNLNRKQAREHLDQLVQKLEAVGETAIAEDAAAQPALEAKRAVFNEIKAGLLSEKVDEKEAQTSALLLASRAETLASARYGKFNGDTMAAWKWMQLKIVGADAKVAKGKKVAQSEFGDIKAAAKANKVHFDAHTQAGSIYLNSVERKDGSLPGAGAEAIRSLLREADRRGLPVRLRASASDDARPQSGLMNYYKGLGFQAVDEKTNEMVREPEGIAEDGFPLEDVLSSYQQSDAMLAGSATLTGHNPTASYMVIRDDQAEALPDAPASQEAVGGQPVASATGTDPAEGNEEQLELYPGADFGIDPTFFGSEIEVDGEFRSTTNSDGQPIAGNRKSIEAFWRWFGDSKGVDKEGRPITFYHGSRNKQFEIFGTGYGGETFFFSIDRETAESFESIDGSFITAYLRIDKMEKYDAEGRMWDAVVEGEYDYSQVEEARDAYVAAEMENWEPSGSVEETEITDKDGTRTVFRVDHPNESEGAEFTDEDEANELLQELQDAEREAKEEALSEVDTWELESENYLSREGLDMSTDAVASQAKAEGLDAVWIDEVDEGSGSTTVVIILGEPRDIKATTNIGTFDAENPSMFKQGPRGEATFYPSGKTVVQLFTKADFSTMLHELSHVFIDQELRLAQEDGASPELKKDVAALKKWFAKHGHPIGEDNRIPAGAHELFARTGERYFREGKAPSAELRETFKQFRKWLTGIYQTIKDLARHGPVPINPEIREIMDRMIATQEAIDANADIAMSQEELGMDDEGYAAHTASLAAAHDDAYDTLLEKMMAAIRRREDKKIGAQRRNVRADVEKEVNTDPRFIALHLLRTGKWLGDPQREATPVKIDTDWLTTTFGEEVLKQLPRGAKLHKGGGDHGDAIAELVGFPSGEAMVRALIGLREQQEQLKANDNPRKLRDQIVEDRVDAIMAERHGDIALDEKQIEEEAIAALNSEKKGEILRRELQLLQQKFGKDGHITPYQILREWARKLVLAGRAGDSISKATLQRHTHALNRARDDLQKALLDQDGDAAIKHKIEEMTSHARVAESKRAADEINAIVKRLNRYAKTETLASIDQDYMDRIHEVLRGYNFKVVSQRSLEGKATFEVWAAAQAEEGSEVYVPEGWRDRAIIARGEALPGEYRSLDSRVNYKDATVAKLIELNDMVQSLVVLGKQQQKIFNDEKKADLASVLERVETSVLALPERKTPDFSTGEEKQTFRDAWNDAETLADYASAVGNLFTSKAGMRDMGSGLIKIEGMADTLDGTSMGTGPLNEVLIHPAADAANFYARLTEEVLGSIITKYKSKGGAALNLSSKVTIDGLLLNVSVHPSDTKRLGKPLTIKRSKLLGLAANCGNLSNLAKLVEGEQWGDHESMENLARVREIIWDKLLPEEAELVQAAWDGLEKLWPHIVKVEREMTGVVPERIAPLEFETKHGVFSGGYWPVVFDRDRSDMGRKAGEMDDNSMFGVATSVGHTITRTGAAAPLEWTFENVLFAHTTKVISRVAYAPWVRDALKVVDNKRIRGAITQRLGKEYHDAIKPWLRDQIPSNKHDINGAKGFERLLDRSRIAMSSAVLGLSYTTMVAQSLGLGYSVAVLGEGSITDGPKWMALGMAKNLALNKEGGIGASMAFVFARSDEMKRRPREFNLETVDAFRKLQGHDSLYNRAQAAAFWHIAMTDLHVVSIPTWLAGYEKAKAQGMGEIAASRYADKVVRKSQGGGRAKDLSAVQRGGALQKMFAMFYTPSSVFFNMQWEAVQAVKAGNYSKAIVPMFWDMAITVLMDAYRDGDWPPEDEEGNFTAGSVTKWVGRNILFGAFYGVPVVRDVANTAERKIRGEYAEWGNAPLSAGFEATARGVTAVPKLWNDEEVEGKDIKNMVSGLGFFFLPGAFQWGKTSGFAYDVNTGAAEPEDFGDWKEGLTTGKLTEEEE